VLIDRPVAQVWKQYLDVGSWVTSHDIEEISEAKRTLGAITRVSFRRAKDLGFPTPHYHYCKIIKLVPEQQCVIKAYSENGGSYGGRIIGFDDTRFEALDGKTRWSFRAFSEYKGELVTKEPEAIKDSEEDNHMLRNMENLKHIVESQPRMKG
jgi:hypothetical protein